MDDALSGLGSQVEPQRPDLLQQRRAVRRRHEVEDSTQRATCAFTDESRQALLAREEGVLRVVDHHVVEPLAGLAQVLHLCHQLLHRRPHVAQQEDFGPSLRAS